MITKVQRWGNSQGLRIPKQVLEETCIGVGDSVEVAVRDGTIVITPARRVRGTHDLKELVSRIPENYKPGETDWGRPKGREAW